MEPNTELVRLDFNDFAYTARVLTQPDAATEPIVMIGGAYQDVYGWRRLEREVTKAATLIIIDLPGSGTAQRLPDTYDFTFLAAALDHALTLLEVPRANLVGMSLGYAAVYGLAQRNPDRVARLALGGASGRITARLRAQFERLLTLLDGGQTTEFGECATNFLMCQNPALTIRNRIPVGRLIRRVLAEAEEIERFADTTRRLLSHPLIQPGGIRDVPSLVFTGEYDVFTEPDLARQVAATIEGARFTTVRETDHLLSLERSKEFADLLMRFFADQSLDGLDYLNPVEIPVTEIAGFPPDSNTTTKEKYRSGQSPAPARWSM